MFYAKENLGSQEQLHEWKSHYCSPPCTWVFYWNLQGIWLLQAVYVCMFWWLGWWQFRALSDQLYRSPEHHKFVRDSVVKQVSNLCLWSRPFYCCSLAYWQRKWLVVKDFLGQRKMTSSLHTSFSVGTSVLCLHKRIWFEIIVLLCIIFTNTMEIQLSFVVLLC
jgi:hypothetical protein